MSHAAPLPPSATSWSLDDIGRLASVTGNAAETLSNVVQLIQHRFGTDVCSVYLLDPDRSNLILAATVGLRPESVGRVRMGLDEGLVGPRRRGAAAADRGRRVPASALQVLPGGWRGSLSLVPRRAAHRSRRAAGRAGRADGRAAGVRSGRWWRLLRRPARQLAPIVSEAAHARTVRRADHERLWRLAQQPVVELGPGHDAASSATSIPALWRSLEHNPMALLQQLPVDDLDERASQLVLHSRINYAYRRLAGIPGVATTPGASATPACCGRGRSPTSRPSSGCTSRCRSTPAAWASWPAITSRAPPTSAFRWSASASFTTRATSGSGSTTTAGSRRSTSTSTPRRCRCEPAPARTARRSRQRRDPHRARSRRGSGRCTVGRSTLLLLDSDVEGNRRRTAS